MIIVRKNVKIQDCQVSLSILYFKMNQNDSQKPYFSNASSLLRAAHLWFTIAIYNLGI